MLLEEKDISSEKKKVKDAERTFTFAGIFNILVSYFQIQALLNIDVQTSSLTMNPTYEFISGIFNFNIPNIMSSLCPNIELDTVRKHFLKDFIFNLLMPCYFIHILLPFG